MMGEDPHLVAELGRAAVEGFTYGGDFNSTKAYWDHLGSIMWEILMSKDAADLCSSLPMVRRHLKGKNQLQGLLAERAKAYSILLCHSALV